MSVTLSGSNAGLFNRIALLAAIARNWVAMKGGTATTPVASGASLATYGTTLETYAASGTAVSAELGDHWATLEAFRTAGGGFMTQLKAIASKVLIRMVDADASLPVRDETTALKELIRQMIGSGSVSNPDNDVNASTVSIGSQTSVGSPVGTLKVVLSAKKGTGVTLQTPFAETLRVRVETDAQSSTGGATARQEQVSVKGQVAVNDVFDHRYPAGSGVSKTLNLVDGRLNNSGGNKLYNSSFDSFNSTNYPVDWVITSGTAGTHVFASGASDAATGGTNALKLTGSGGTTITLTHSFDTAHSTTQGSGGTPYELVPGTQYAFHVLVKALSAAPAAGVLRFSLVDASGDVLNDDFGTANSTDVDLTLITTSYVSYTGTFRVPSNLGTDTPLKLRITTSTAITNSSSIVIDDLALAPMTSLYDGGPSAAAFAAETAPVIGDSWTFAVSNTRGLFMDWFERFFSLAAKGLVLPYDTGAGETIADSIITGL